MENCGNEKRKKIVKGMKKLISNKAVRAIRRISQVPPEEIKTLLIQKLLEEFSEYLFSYNEEELKDIELICKEIRKPDKYSEGWVLVNSRGHQQDK